MKRVLVIGAWRSHTGGGCCSASGESLGEKATRPDEECSRWAAVYLAVKKAVPLGVDVQLVDPRNSLFLIPAVYRDARRAGRDRIRAVAVAVRATTPQTLVVDGVVVSRSVDLTPDQAVRLLPVHSPAR